MIIPHLNLQEIKGLFSLIFWLALKYQPHSGVITLNRTPFLTQKVITGTDITVSPLGLGTVKLGRNQQVKYLESFKIPDDKEASNLLSLAQSMGINLLDTAPAYGTSEKRLGKLLNKSRQDWVICSKVGEEYDNGASRFDFTPKHIRFSIERSLKRLNTDFIDIILIHSSGNDVSIIKKFGCLEILADFKKEGLIRAFGMSTKTVDGGIMALTNSDIVMMTYNLDDQSETSVLDFAKEQEKGIFIKKSLASGHACLKGQLSVYDSMKLVFAHSAVSSVIIGTINQNHLKQNVKVCNTVLDHSR